MEMYFIKSAACLAILMLFYKLLLEKENMHIIKRIYLLAIPVISFGIPFITFPEYIQISSEAVAPFSSFEVSEKPSKFPLFEWLLAGIYLVGVLFFGSRFILNLYSLLKKAEINPKVKTEQATQVLLKDNVDPHTFWNFVYLNKRKYKNNQIPQEVLDHEFAHVRQKHTADVLFLEILQIFLWFLPLIYLLKKAVKLNHEFLADKAVLDSAYNSRSYQQILLSFSSGENHSLVNSINYQSIKKRFTVMKKQPSKKAILMRYFLFLPLLAGLLYSFSGKEIVVVEEATSNTEVIQKSATPAEIKKYNELIKHYNSKQNPIYKKKDVDFLKMVYDRMSQKQKAAAEPFPNFPEFPPKKDSSQEKATPEMIEFYNSLARKLRKYNEKSDYGKSHPKDASPILMKDIQKMNYIYSIMSENQKKKAEPLPGFYPPPPPPPPAPKVYKKGDVPPPPPPPPAPEKLGEQLPPPPPPPTPEEAVKKWIAEGAEFFYNDKKISGKEILTIVQKNNGKNLSVKVQENGSGKTVRISDDKK